MPTKPKNRHGVDASRITRKQARKTGTNRIARHHQATMRLQPAKPKPATRAIGKMIQSGVSFGFVPAF